jgi:hypothetical protein
MMWFLAVQGRLGFRSYFSNEMSIASILAAQSLRGSISARGEIMSNNDDLNKTGNPIMDKFLSSTDTPEKAMARAEAMDVAAKQFNSGAPIASVKASDLRQLWDADRRMRADMGPPKPGGAVGLAVYAAYGFEAAAGDPGELLPITMRHKLMSALIERGVLSDYMQGEDPDEQVFRAAATMPCNKDDFFEAIMPEMLTLMPADDVAKLKEDTQAHGYDVNKPSVDVKFIEWLRTKC